jgi:acyl-CoA synthetase (AMP-forming)/AMP-acid ligase II
VNLAMLLEMAVAGAGDRIVVGSRERGLTAAELQQRASAAAARFGKHPIESVVLVDENSDAVPIALFGAALAGVPFAPLNYRLPDDQLAALVERLVPAAVVAGPDAVGRLESLDGITMIERDVLHDDRDASAAAAGADVDPESVAVLLFTSGTTGVAKAAMLRHRHLVSYVIGTVEFMGASEDDAQLVAVPPYHIAGISTILTCLYGGRRIVYLTAFDPDVWVNTAADERVSHAMVVPTMLGRILDVIEARGTQLPSLRHLSYGGGRMPVDVVERAMTLLPAVDFVNAYGLTETSSTVAVLGPEEHRAAFRSDDATVRARLKSVGVPLPGVEVEIRATDGSVVAPGERGEIHVRGEQVAGEYVGRSMLTDDGWFPTNDAGYFDETGILFLEGRLDDVIVRGAENLSPGEIEDVLVAHPAVVAACVVGVPDAQWGEAVAAAVVLTDDAAVSDEQLKSWVRTRLRSTKTPVHIVFRDVLPHTETGKLLRRVVRDELAGAPVNGSETQTP